jgi:predicted GIY-YIG superfamily endonuclease
MNHIVYKWRCKDESVEPYYIGYSMDFSARVRSHQKCYFQQGVKYNFVRKYGGWDSWEFEIIARFTNEREARNYESYLIRKETPLLNVVGLWYEVLKTNRLILELEYGIEFNNSTT